MQDAFWCVAARDIAKLTTGKRLFRTWLQAPLREIADINARLDAVDDLLKYSAFASRFATFVKSLPDLEVSAPADQRSQ